MNLSFPSREFDDAVAAVCHGSATEAQLLALNDLLRGSARARDEYLLRVELHSRLASAPELFARAADEMADCCARVIKLDDRRDVLSRPPVVRTTRRRMVKVLALAAGYALVAAGGWSLWFGRPATRSGATSTAVAMLTRTVDARWGQSVGSLRVGSALEPGRLRLESGLAQVVFYSGARVVIEGPAELWLSSRNEAACPTGRLLAEVPPAARGFRLKTENLEVVDLGTAFGIDASRAGSEVHVFKGKVELLPGTTARQSLGEGQAALVKGNTPPRLMAANAAAFTALFDFQQRSLASEAFRYEQWQFANAQLNQDPSLVVRLDFENLSGSDWTLRNAAKEDRSVPEATVVGCQRGEGRWPEKQALEFQNVNDRVRLVVPGEFEALTCSVWVCVKGLDRQFNSLFMCDGFAPGTIHWLIRNDGVLGVTVFGRRSGNFEILASPPVLTLDTFGMWLHLAVVVDGAARQVVHYFNGLPVSRHVLTSGPPFRIGPAELGNWNVHNTPDPNPVLVRNLSGALDEFELFSRALTDDQVRALYAQGKPEP
jgi:hypothetical protein